MKRLFALLLVVAMLLSLCVLPISAAEQSKMSVASFTTFTVGEDGYVVYGAPKTTPYEKDDLVAVKATFHNAEAETIKLMSIEMVMEYDSSVLEPYTWEFEGDTYGIAVFADSFKMEAAASVIAEGKSKISGASSRGVNVTAGATIDVAYYLFKVKNDIESGDAAFTLKIDELTKKGAAAGEADDIKDSVAIEENTMPVSGKAPTIGSTSVDKSEVVYGSDEVLTLGATSTSNKDITSFVTFKVKDAEGNDAAGFVVNNGNELNVAAADAGTYTVTAEPNGDNCRIDESVTVQNATLTITKQEITAPVATVTSFAKGQRIFDLNVETTTPGLSVGSTCYEGTNTDGNPLDSQEKFKAGTLYSIVIGLEADKNHVLNAQTLTVTVNGGEPQTVAIEESGFAGAYKAVVTATTADKDAPTITPNPINATYGDKLFTHTPTGTAIYDGQNVSGTFTWSNKYNAETTVGNAGVNEFDVVFTPTNTDLYATVTGKVTVTVAQKEIDITDKLNTWSANEFTYDGKSHSVELKIDEDLVGIVKVKEYTGDTEAQAVGEYTASASLELVDPANYKFNEDNVLTRDHTWKINKGDLTPTDAEKSVLFGTKEVTVTPADFGLMQDGIKIEVTHAGNSLITGYLPSDDMRSVTFMLRDTDKTDAANNASDTATLKFSSANYNEASGTLTIKIIDKNTDADTLKIDVPATVTYGDTVTPSVGESKPAGAGNVTFKFFVEDNHEVLTTAQPFDAGTYKVTASCESESTIYTAEATFTVEPREIEAKDVAFDKELTYTGNELTQTVTVTVNGKTLTVGTDYTVSDLTGTEPGSYPVTVAGTGNYTGTVTKSFEIAKADISSAEITYDAGPYGYTGKEWKPEVAVSFNDAALTADTDYTVSYENNINAGTAKIIITGIGDHFTGSTEKTFTINSAEISGCTFAPIADVTYNTKAHTPEVTVAISGRTLEADKDYTVSYASNINAGTATVTVTGKGNFTGTASKTFTINKAGLTLNPCTISELCTETDLKTRTLPSDFFLAGETETGFSIELTAVAGGDDIFAVAPAVVEGENKITFRLKNEVGAATFTVTVTPVSGNYNGGSYALTISTHDRTDVSGSISFPDGSAVYTGTGIKYENATISGYSGTLRYGYTPNASTGASLDASGLPLTVGTYTVAVTFNSDASFGYKTATFTITKATPTGTPGYTKLETNGKTLADAKLTVGTIRPAGTIAWDLPLTTVLEDGKAYAWTFTPADTHNYTILTGTLVPYVDDGMDYIPGVIGGNTGSFNFHDVSRLDYFYDAVKWAAENGIASGTGRYTFSPNAVCTRAQTVTFLWRAAGSPLPRYRVCPFTDVQPSDYYYNAVLWAVEQGITTGLNATTFGPDVTVTRGQVATFLYRAASAAKPNTFSPFTDVKTTAYNYNAILWAYDNRITTGTSATTFSPNASCTRAQIVTFLWRASGSPEPKTASNPFTDVAANAYYCKAVLWAVENGITTGTSATTFSPDSPCTRAQGVTFLWRANGSKAASAAASFTDVASDAYYAPAVAWAAEQNVTGGVGNGLFSSDTTCTRAQIVSMLYRLR